jgi:acyl-CoA thioesterase
MAEDDDHPFDAAVRLTSSDGVWAGRTHPGYWNMNGPYGGITAATLLSAALEGPDTGAEPVTMTVNFCAPIREGVFRIARTDLRAGKNVRHLTIELRQDADTVAAQASVVLARKRDTWSHQVAAMPAAPAPHLVERFATGGRLAWLERYDFRFVAGLPAFDNSLRMPPASPYSLLWVRDVPERPLDYASLAGLCDAFFVRIFQVRGLFVPAATVSMTIHFHASRDDLAAQGARHLLGEVDAAVLRRNFADQTARLWSGDGKLLATTTQIVWFKE